MGQKGLLFDELYKRVVSRIPYILKAHISFLITKTPTAGTVLYRSLTTTLS